MANDLCDFYNKNMWKKAIIQIVSKGVITHFQVLSRIIKEFSNKKFTINLTLLSAREPIVKFTHNESNIKCDLTLNNRIVLENTKLAILFLDLNPHVKYLVYIVRYWAKHYGLTGPGALFSTYTIQMLVFFYLQRTNPQIIPNLWQLCEMSSKLLTSNSFIKHIMVTHVMHHNSLF